MQPVTVTVVTDVVTKEERLIKSEEVVEERPYRVYLNEEPVGYSMVLPTGLEEFGVGFLFAQGYITEPSQVKEVRLCHERGGIYVYATVEEVKKKETIITSGCGGTGRISVEFLTKEFGRLEEYEISLEEVRRFITSVLKASDLQRRTHCVHGCGLWQDGTLKLFYEDVGRHNAVDKVVGAILLGKASARAAVYTTGRLTSDMVLKCARIGIPIVMSRTSTSTLGLEIARRAGITLVCYARPDRLNVFNAPHRIIV